MNKLLLSGAASFLMLCLAGTVHATEPIPGIDIIFDKEPEGEQARGSTNERGRFTVRSIRPGGYVIRLRGGRFPRGAKGGVSVTISGTQRGTQRFRTSKRQLMKGARFRVKLKGPAVSVTAIAE